MIFRHDKLTFRDENKILYETFRDKFYFVIKGNFFYNDMKLKQLKYKTKKCR